MTKLPESIFMIADKNYATIVVALLTGCASTTDVMKMGPETYRVSAAASPARGGPAGAQGMALEAANKYCTKDSKEILVVNTATFHGAGSSEVTFRCLDKGDPELQQRPDYRKTPDVLIEDSRK